MSRANWQIKGGSIIHLLFRILMHYIRSFVRSKLTACEKIRNLKLTFEWMRDLWKFQSDTSKNKISKTRNVMCFLSLLLTVDCFFLFFTWNFPPQNLSISHLSPLVISRISLSHIDKCIFIGIYLFTFVLIARADSARQRSVLLIGINNTSKMITALDQCRVIIASHQISRDIRTQYRMLLEHTKFAMITTLPGQVVIAHEDDPRVTLAHR